MTLRSLDSLAHSLGAATTLDAALVALGECIADVDRGAAVAYLKVDAELVGIVALREPSRVFGVSVAERAGPLAALFDLAVQRFVERDTRAEAQRAVEDISQRLHGEYLARLAALETQLREVRAAT